jgi:hypothetical protein
MNLKKLQKDFAAHLCDKSDEAILTQIKSINSASRLQIYRNNVFGNFDDVLASIYPAVKKTVGADYFEQICQKYHLAHPSQSGNLDNYGRHFGKFLHQIKKEHKILYLKELAELEWHYHDAYFAKDVGDFDLESFQKLSEEQWCQLQFKLHHSCVLMAPKYPINQIWQFCQDKVSESQNLDLEKLEKEYLLIARINFDIEICNLSAAEFAFLQKIKKKENIYQIYEGLTDKFADFDIGQTVNKFINNRVLCQFLLQKS